MSGARTYWVTAAGEETVWRVTVRPSGTDWILELVSDGADPLTYRLREGTGPGRVWVGDRPIVYGWRAADSGRGSLSLDGSTHHLTVESEARHRLAELGLTGPEAASTREVRAPMPGLIVAARVAAGETVDEGGDLFVIEAMKMENEIRAPIGGIVTELAVEVSQPVEQGALLCRIDPAGPAPEAS